MGVPQKFIDSLSGKTLAKPSHFEVVIHDNLYKTNKMHLRCHQAVLPGITAATSQYGTGMPEKNNPYRATFEDVALSFYCTDNLQEKTYFDIWMGTIFPTLTELTGEKVSPKYISWPIGYRDSFTRNIEITKFSQHGKEIDSNWDSNPIHKYILHNAFPTIVNDATLEWGDEEILKLEVTFSYDWWSSSPIEQPREMPNQIQEEITPSISSNEPKSFGKRLASTWGDYKEQDGIPFGPFK